MDLGVSTYTGTDFNKERVLYSAVQWSPDACTGVYFPARIHPASRFKSGFADRKQFLNRGGDNL